MRQGTCKHFNGDFHNTHCDAGVCYDDVTPRPDDETGIAWRRPCRAYYVLSKHAKECLKSHGPQGTCEKFEEPTDQEIIEHKAAMDAAIAKTMLALPLMHKIKDEHKGEDWQGTEACPACGGVLHMSHAAMNGHVWGKCETEDCIAWME